MSRAATLALLVLAVGLGGCVESVRVSRGTRMPEELRGASSAQVVEHFTRLDRGTELSVVATLIDFSYLRALSRERGRATEVEREAYDRYLRRQTTFYVYLTLHEAESCTPGARPPSGARAEDEDEEEEDEGPRPLRGRLDLRAWSFTLSTPGRPDREAQDVEPGPTQLASGGGCLIQGYIHFRGSPPRDARSLVLHVSEGEGRDALRSELRWDLEPWSPPRRSRSRRPRPDRAREAVAPSAPSEEPGEAPAAPSEEPPPAAP